MLDCVGLIVLHRKRAVLLDLDRQNFLGVQQDLLRSFLVLETKFVGVVRRPFLAAARFHSRLRGIVRQRVRRLGVAVIHAAGDNRTVRIAVQEIHQHFLTHARDMDGAPLRAGPQLRDPHPAGTLLIVPARAIPVELHFYAAHLIGVDLIAGLADHHGGLRAVHDGLWRGSCRPKRRAGIDLFRGY